ncbi:MerR family transcriptional regulator [Brevibacillus sp. Leaf182]|uniref:MerR family transcriptional regulator n=1 Tax=Brevibacillus sp. Leaf182 TaxID=1736290 RepID=UPI0006FB1636|nr:MerR family transcriptional regulator [Brevibacillus sp. Leaf182]RAT99762.1 MerR family DNA-binding transcriptional regulator [Brevibacillus sp. Leaf182]
MGDQPLTIQQAAARTGLSVHTLRYYEKMGLMEPIPRGENGHRSYYAHDLEWIDLIARLRTTGMPIAEMQRFVRLDRTTSQCTCFRLPKFWFQNRPTHFLSIIGSLSRCWWYFLDTANNYAFWNNGCVGGESELLLGQWMRERQNRSHMFIATKVGAKPLFPGGDLQTRKAWEVETRNISREKNMV